MKFTQSGGQTGAGPKDWFTGAVHIDGSATPTTSRPSGARTSASHPEHAPPGTATPRARPST